MSESKITRKFVFSASSGPDFPSQAVEPEGSQSLIQHHPNAWHLFFWPCFPWWLTRFLRDFGGEPMVVSIHKYPTAGPVNVCHLSLRARCGPEWSFTTPNSHPLCQPGIRAGAAFREHSCAQALPHYGARGGCRCLGGRSPWVGGWMSWLSSRDGKV